MIWLQAAKQAEGPVDLITDSGQEYPLGRYAIAVSAFPVVVPTLRRTPLKGIAQPNAIFCI
jgi:hypothetical protein